MNEIDNDKSEYLKKRYTGNPYFKDTETREAEKQAQKRIWGQKENSKGGIEHE